MPRDKYGGDRDGRFIACRHVLCQACVEQTVRYFRECPLCYQCLQTDDFMFDPYRDASHERVMKLKLDTLTTMPPTVVAAQVGAAALTGLIARNRLASRRAQLDKACIA